MLKAVATIEERMRFFFVVGDGQGPVYIRDVRFTLLFVSFTRWSSSIVSHWCNYWWTSFLLFVLLSHHQRRRERSFSLFFFRDSIAKPWHVRIILGVDIIFPSIKGRKSNSVFLFIASIRIIDKAKQTIVHWVRIYREAVSGRCRSNPYSYRKHWSNERLISLWEITINRQFIRTPVWRQIESKSISWFGRSLVVYNFNEAAEGWDSWMAMISSTMIQSKWSSLFVTAITFVYFLSFASICSVGWLAFIVVIGKISWIRRWRQRISQRHRLMTEERIKRLDHLFVDRIIWTCSRHKHLLTSLFFSSLPSIDF